MRGVRSILTCSVLASLSAGCSSSEEVVILDNPVAPELTDDAAPPLAVFDPSLDYVGRTGPANHSTDRFRFDVAPFRDDSERLDAETLHPSHAAFMAAHTDAIPSVQTLVTYEKQLDDRIYAGVERAVQDGLAPTLPPKTEILTGALGYLTAHRGPAADKALAYVAAALELGGAKPSVPADLSAAVKGVEDGFLADPEALKPIGFYTWSAPLQAIWRQDRLLQKPLEKAAACALAGALAADTGRWQRYVELTNLYSRMTNPLRSSLFDVLPAPGQGCKGVQAAFLGSSATPEVALFEELYPGGLPKDGDMMKDLVNAIRAGTLDLAPAPEDGWYAHQLFALETLLVTDKSEERSKVAFMARYKKRLQEAFETLLTQHRETHVKQADTMEPVSLDLPDTPAFRLEPLATVFVRHARSYVFLEAALDAVNGTELLDQGQSVAAEGPTGASLRDAIRSSRDTFFGLYLLSCQDLGLRPKLDAVGDPAPDAWPALAKAADAWLLGLPDDPIAASDVRVIVPIAHTEDGRARYWAVIGVRETLAGYSFIDGMDTSAPAPDAQWRVPLPTEQFIEVTSSATPLTREEFRALCDQEKTPEAIRSALEELQ